MLVIRLQRTGRRNSPAYRIVVAEKTAPVKGKSVEVIGHYLPTRDPASFECNEDRVTYWVGKGAVPSDTVARLLAKSGVKGLEKFVKRYAKQKPKKEVEEEAPAPAAPPVAETPATEEETKETEDSKDKEPAEQPSAVADAEKKEEEPKEEPDGDKEEKAE